MLFYQKIGKEWKHLAERLFDVDDELLRRIDHDDNLSYAEKLRDCFKLVKDKVTWSKLEQCLLFVDKSKIIKEVKSSTLLTEGESH